jgi:hypothetical protein
LALRLKTTAGDDGPLNGKKPVHATLTIQHDALKHLLNKGKGNNNSSKKKKKNSKGQQTVILYKSHIYSQQNYSFFILLDLLKSHYNNI